MDNSTIALNGNANIQIIPTGLNGQTALQFNTTSINRVGLIPFRDDNAFTMGCVFSTTQVPGKIGLVAIMYTSAYGFNATNLYLTTAGAIRCDITGTWSRTASPLIGYTTPTGYNDGTAHFVVATNSPADGITLYVDGKRIGNTPPGGTGVYWTPPPITAQSFYVGYCSGATPNFNGLIGAAMYFTSALTAQDVTLLTAQMRSTFAF
ncbi:MAG TPA: hypothetical protein PLZ36_09330 [Armatimonadota bacterium]|nr:hypothetical protein [Armatimonadota bacterium]